MVSIEFDFSKYEKYFKAIGFGDYALDFSGVSDEDTTKICDFIIKLVKDK
jgi:hypothetical protein